jgi:hypothetical protein
MLIVFICYVHWLVVRANTLTAPLLSIGLVQLRPGGVAGGGCHLGHYFSASISSRTREPSRPQLIDNMSGREWARAG